MIKAIIYDVDGTMVDSEPLHVAAWGNALNHYGHSLSDLSDQFQATMAGKKPIAIAEGMVGELDLSITADELLQTKATIFMDSVRTDLQPMPGAVESIKTFKQQGYKLGIGTSLDRGYIDLVLERLDAADDFDVIVTGDEITHGKPHPETYLTVVEQLGLTPAECVVLEDAKTGIESAKAAGCYCIAIENPNAIKQDTSEADKTITDLTDAMELLHD